MTEHQQGLLENIREIEDPSILALLKDGVEQRASRVDMMQDPVALSAADQFFAEIKKLYEKSFGFRN